MRIVATMVDGTVYETDTALFCCLADRLAFREKFGRSWNAVKTEYMGPGKLWLDDPELAETWDERWTSFFAWRALARNGYPESFEDFMTSVLEIDVPRPRPSDSPTSDEVAKPEEEQVEDPTGTSGETTSTETTSSSPISLVASE